MNKLTAWSSRQNPWKLAAFVFCIYGMAMLEYWSSLSHPAPWYPMCFDLITDVINTVAVIYMLVHLFLKK